MAPVAQSVDCLTANSCRAVIWSPFGAAKKFDNDYNVLNLGCAPCQAERPYFFFIITQNATIRLLPVRHIYDFHFPVWLKFTNSSPVSQAVIYSSTPVPSTWPPGRHTGSSCSKPELWTTNCMWPPPHLHGICRPRTTLGDILALWDLGECTRWPISLDTWAIALTVMQIDLHHQFYLNLSHLYIMCALCKIQVNSMNY